MRIQYFAKLAVLLVFGISPVYPLVADDTSGLSLEANQQGSRIDINRASVEELAAALPGIGPVKAEAIVAWRESVGLYRRAEDLLPVKGIGVRTIERLAPFIRFASNAAEEARRASLARARVQQAARVQRILSLVRDASGAASARH